MILIDHPYEKGEAWAVIAKGREAYAYINQQQRFQIKERTKEWYEARAILKVAQERLTANPEDESATEQFEQAKKHFENMDKTTTKPTASANKGAA